MIVRFLQIFNDFNTSLFNNFDAYIESLQLQMWLTSTILDSTHTLPILFIIFIIIAFAECYFLDNIKNLIKSTEKSSPIIGSFLAIIPQCGFSIISSLLYLKKYISRGTLIAIYLATSDEAIPILLTTPDKYKYILPIISTKLIVAIVSGYVVDFIIKTDKVTEPRNIITIKNVKGCCKHSFKGKLNILLIHPLKHTLNIFCFIFFITLFLNFFISICASNSCIYNIVHKFKLVEPIIVAFLGLIPNCAISISLTMLLIKGTLTFSTVIAGLLSNAGLGLLVLFKECVNFKDISQIIFVLLIVSILTSYILKLIGV